MGTGSSRNDVDWCLRDFAAKAADWEHDNVGTGQSYVYADDGMSSSSMGDAAVDHLERDVRSSVERARSDLS